MYVTIFGTDWAQKTSLAILVLKSSDLKQSLPNSQHKLLQTSQYEAYIDFSCKFLGCYIEAAQNFFMYVTIFGTDWAQKTSLAILVLKSSVLKQSLPNPQNKLLQTSQYKAYIDPAQNFIRYLTIFVTDWTQKLPLLYWF